MDQAPTLYNRVVSPNGAWDLWAGPLRSFQSGVRSPEFCCRGLLAVERPAWGDEACKVSKFLHSPHETHFYWPKGFKAKNTAQSIEINVQLHKPREKIRENWFIISWHEMVALVGVNTWKLEKPFETRGGAKTFALSYPCILEIPSQQA